MLSVIPKPKIQPGQSLDPSLMARLSNRSVYNKKQRKSAPTIVRKSSVGIITFVNGRRRTKTYGVEKAVRIPSNATGYPTTHEESPKNDEMGMEGLTENVMVVTPQSRKTKARTPCGICKAS
jgi:hypothetical protein